MGLFDFANLGNSPGWLSALLSDPNAMGAPPSQGFAQGGMFGGPGLPQSAMGGGYGGGVFPSQPQPSFPQNAMAQAPQPQPPQMQQPDIGLGARLSAGAANFESGGNPISMLANVAQGLMTGQRFDRQGVLQQSQNATLQALIGAGVPPAVAQAAALNPEVLKTIAPQIYTKPEFKTIKNALGEDVPIFADASKGTISYPAANGVAGGGPGMSLLAPGVKFNSSLSGEDYLKQFGPEVQAAVKAYMNGDVMPTGNPRAQGISTLAKTIAQKYGQDMGIPVNDQIYAGKRKMQTDLASSSPNSTGGIISNGKSAFAHLADASDRLVDIGNYSSNIPVIGGNLAAAANYIGNNITPTSEQKGKLTAAADNLLKYGQEATKFYAGSGGGEGERMAALKNHDISKSSGMENAAFLETEKRLMMDRLNQKEAQIRDTLGDKYLQDHPVMTPDFQDKLSRIDANIAKLRGQKTETSADGWTTIGNGIRIREKK